MQAVAYTINTTEKQLVVGFVGALVTLFMIYGFFVNATIVNIVERKASEALAGELLATITNLEIAHSELRAGITHEYARSIGFVRQEEQIFARAQQLVKNVTIGL